MVIFAIIIVVFAFSFGAPTDGCSSSGGAQEVASVAGHSLKTDEINLVYYRTRQARQRDLDEATLLDAQARSARALILMHLLADEAERMGLRATDEEFRDYLLDPLRNAEFLGAYGSNGKLDGTYYKNYVQNGLRVSLPRYEAFKKRELLARKYLELAIMQIDALPAEIEARVALRDTKVNLEYVKLSAQELQDNLPISDEEASAFSAANADKIKASYDADKDKYEQDAEVQVRRIYILRPDESSTEDLKQAAQDKFNAAKKRVLEDKEDFGVVAGELSEDYAKKDQGLMEWSTTENMSQDIAKAIEGVEQGSVKEVVTDFAYMLVKVEGRKEAKTTPLDEVKLDLARDLLRAQKASAVTKQMMDRLQAEAPNHPTLAAALDAIKAAEAPAEGEQQPASPWDAVSAKETGMFSQEGQDMSAMFGGQLPPGLDISMFGGSWDRIPGIGQNRQIALDAFTLTSEKPLAPKPYAMPDGEVIIRLKARQAPGDSAKKDDAQAEDAAKDDSADAKVDPSVAAALKVEGELRQKRINELARGWQSLFAEPQDSYGPWLESLYKQAVKDNRVKLSGRQKIGMALQSKLEPIKLDLSAADSAAKPATAAP